MTDEKIVMVFIKDIIRDAGYQVRSALDASTVERYKRQHREGAKFPPVSIAKVGGALILVDGWHRIAAQEANHEIQVEAKVVEATEAEAKWMAGEANLNHGLPLKRSEIRNVFRAYVKAGQWRKRKGATYARGKSYREIAKEIGGWVSHTTVRSWMRADFPSIASKLSIGDAEKFDGVTTGRLKWSPLFETSRRHLEEAAAAGRGVEDDDERAELVKLSRHVGGVIKAGSLAPMGKLPNVDETQAVVF